MTRPEAARRNGALSSGPVTDAGKAASSRNAIRHGLTSAEIVIPGEDPRAFDALLECMRIDFQPVTPRETDLVFEMTAARWRMRRLMIMERAVIECEIERRTAEAKDGKENAQPSTPEQQRAQAWAAVADSNAMKQIHRHETRLHRQYEKARLELVAVVEERVFVEQEGGRPHPCRLVPSRLDQTTPAESEKPASAPVQNEPDAKTSGTAAAPRSAPATQEKLRTASSGRTNTPATHTIQAQQRTSGTPGKTGTRAA